MDLGLKDKVFIVTGGTAGLGLATTKVLLAEGARAIVSARSKERFEDAFGDGDQAPRVAFVSGDIVDPELPRRLVTAALDRWNRIDGLLVSTGGPPPGKILDADDETWRAAFEQVLLGAVRIVREIAPAITEGGAVALVLASSSKEASPLITLSNGLRPGLAMLVKSFASELGPRNIRVNALLPYLFSTERTMALLGDRPLPLDGVALGRIGDPQEFGRMAAVLLSPIASYVTGASLSIDGGRSQVI